MVKASKGMRRRSRGIMRRRPRDRGLSPLTRRFQRFSDGDIAHIKVDPSIHGGLPSLRYQGLTGRIVGTQGRCYYIEVRRGRKPRRILVGPEHLVRAEV